MRLFWRRLMPLKKILIVIVAVVVYLNIGYLIIYSLDPTTSQTALSNFTYRTIDFMGALGRFDSSANSLWSTSDKVLAVIILLSASWPILVMAGWMANFGLLLWKIFVWIGAVLIWMTTGGIWRWFGWIK